MAPGCDSAYIRNVRRHPSAVPKLYRLYDAHAFISHAFPLGQTDPFASFLPLFRRIGSKNVKNDLRVQCFFFKKFVSFLFLFFFLKENLNFDVDEFELSLHYCRVFSDTKTHLKSLYTRSTMLRKHERSET